jgi:hypothetical protein
MSNARRVGAVPVEDERTDTNQFDIPGKAQATASPESVMADIAADLSKEQEAAEPIAVVVPKRPNYKLLFRTDIDFDDLRLWMKKAKEGKGDKADTNALRLALAVIINTNVGLLFQGNEATARDGRPLTVHHPELQALLKTPTGGVPAAVRKFYGNDGHIILTMQRILEEAGYSADVDLEGDDGPFEI